MRFCSIDWFDSTREGTLSGSGVECEGPPFCGADRRGLPNKVSVRTSSKVFKSWTIDTIILGYIIIENNDTFETLREPSFPWDEVLTIYLIVGQLSIDIRRRTCENTNNILRKIF